EAALLFNHVFAVVGDTLHATVTLCVVGIPSQRFFSGQRIDHVLAVDVEDITILTIIILHILPNGTSTFVFHDASTLWDIDLCKKSLTGTWKCRPFYIEMFFQKSH